MKAKEIRSLDEKGREEKLLELRKELLKLNAQVAVGSAVKNPGQIRKVRKTIARVLTIQNQKLAQQVQTQKSKPKKGEKTASKKQEVKKQA